MQFERSFSPPTNLGNLLTAVKGSRLDDCSSQGE